MPFRDRSRKFIFAALLFLCTTAAFAQSASISIQKVAAPDPVAAGQDLTYDITASNEGPSDAQNVDVHDPLPAGTTFASLTPPAGWSCTTPAVGTNGTVDCTTATFTPGSVDFIIVVHTDPSLANGSTISNTATISSTTPDPRTSDNTFTTNTFVESLVDLGVTKTSASTVIAGSPLTYTIGYSASGPSVASNVTLTDVLPAGTTFTSVAATGWSCMTPAVGTNGTITCTLPSLGVGGSGSITITVGFDPSLPAGTMVANTITISGDVVDNNPMNDSATKTVTTTASSDLSVTKNAGVALAGSTVTYTIGYTNAGPSTATTVSLTDPLPAGTTFSSITAAGWNCTTPAVGASGTVTCTMASLTPGSGSITLILNIDPATFGTLMNTASISNAISDPNGANNSATSSTSITTNADLGVTILGAPNPVFPSIPLTYTVTVTKSGPSNATNATLSVALSPLANFASIIPAAGWSCITPAVGATGSIACTQPSLSAASGTFTIGTITSAALVNNGSIVTTATVSSSATDPNPANNNASATTITGGPIPTLSPRMLLLLAIALAMAGLVVKR
jgi:uncharacterized repeat protein (TIGR01451 family)